VYNYACVAHNWNATTAPYPWCGRKRKEHTMRIIILTVLALASIAAVAQDVEDVKPALQPLAVQQARTPTTEIHAALLQPFTIQQVGMAPSEVRAALQPWTAQQPTVTEAEVRGALEPWLRVRVPRK